MSYYPDRNREQEHVSQAREPGAAESAPGASARFTAAKARGAALSVLSFDPLSLDSSPVDPDGGTHSPTEASHYFGDFGR